MAQLQNIISRLGALSIRQQVTAALGVLAVLVTFATMVRLVSADRMELLYAALDPAAAGEVVARLDQLALPYEIRGDSIFVSAAARDELRLSMAAEGLPRSSAQGYELLDSLSGFGTTAQMFDAAYWRAKEGELARTLMAAPDIRDARVHLATSQSAPFRDAVSPTASVTLVAAAPLGQARATAVRHLVASAVPRLQTADVAVIDGTTGRVIEPDDILSPVAADDRGDRLRMRLERLLAARVGPGKAVVEVSVETVNETEAIVERRLDPDSRVAISQETEERSASSSDAADASVTVASNLPDGDAGGEGTSRSSDSETREVVNYEVSETTREVTRMPGAVRRISIAVLVDGVTAPDPATGDPVWTARGDAEIEALEALVASAAGIDPARGDQVTVQSLQFSPPVELPAAPEPALFDATQINAMALIQIGVLALVTLILGLFVIRPLLKPTAVPAPTAPLSLAPGTSGAMAAGRLPAPGLADAARAPLPAELQPESPRLTDPGEARLQAADLTADPTSPAPSPARSISADTNAVDQDIDDPVARLKELIESRREETVELLQSWIDDPDEETA